MHVFGEGARRQSYQVGHTRTRWACPFGVCDNAGGRTRRAWSLSTRSAWSVRNLCCPYTWVSWNHTTASPCTNNTPHRKVSNASSCPKTNSRRNSRSSGPTYNPRIAAWDIDARSSRVSRPTLASEAWTRSSPNCARAWTPPSTRSGCANTRWGFSGSTRRISQRCAERAHGLDRVAWWAESAADPIFGAADDAAAHVRRRLRWQRRRGWRGEQWGNWRDALCEVRVLGVE